jgi:hypothetical protein
MGGMRPGLAPGERKWSFGGGCAVIAQDKGEFYPNASTKDGLYSACKPRPTEHTCATTCASIAVV